MAALLASTTAGIRPCVAPVDRPRFSRRLILIGSDQFSDGENAGSREPRRHDPKFPLEDTDTKTISVEEMVVITEDGAEWLVPPQQDLILIRSR